MAPRSGSPSAAVRQTSVLFALTLAARMLGERVTRNRLVGAVLVAAGVLALASSERPL